MIEKLDWEKAESYLKQCEQAYQEIGTAGIFAMQFVIEPCRKRFLEGERTQELYSEIFEIAL